MISKVIWGKIGFFKLWIGKWDSIDFLSDYLTIILELEGSNTNSLIP